MSTKKSAKKSSKQQELEQRIEELTNDVKRVQADFANYKRRAEEEKQSSIDYGAQQMIAALLPTIDNIKRALSHVPEEIAENPWAKGVSKVAEQLSKDLEKIGVTEIGAVGEEFDPEHHEAVSVEGEGAQEIVGEVLQTGYMYKTVIIRHAMVKVKAQ